MITSDEQYNNNEWHTVHLVREMKHDVTNGTVVHGTVYDDVITSVDLSINGRVKSYTANLEFKQWNLDDYLNVGGKDFFCGPQFSTFFHPLPKHLFTQVSYELGNQR